MKKIINNRVYDTDTAQELGSWSNDGSWRDFSHTEETLYRKRTGEFFLHGEGGPMTKYAVMTGQNSWSGGEKIIPLTPESARKWVEEKLDADAYERIFGLPDENAEPVMVSAQLPAELVARARQRAAEQSTSLTAVIEAALNNYL